MPRPLANPPSPAQDREREREHCCRIQLQKALQRRSLEQTQIFHPERHHLEQLAELQPSLQAKFHGLHGTPRSWQEELKELHSRQHGSGNGQFGKLEALRMADARVRGHANEARTASALRAMTTETPSQPHLEPEPRKPLLNATW